MTDPCILSEPTWTGWAWCLNQDHDCCGKVPHPAWGHLRGLLAAIHYALTACILFLLAPIVQLW